MEKTFVSARLSLNGRRFQSPGGDKLRQESSFRQLRVLRVRAACTGAVLRAPTFFTSLYLYLRSPAEAVIFMFETPRCWPHQRWLPASGARSACPARRRRLRSAVLQVVRFPSEVGGGEVERLKSFCVVLQPLQSPNLLDDHAAEEAIELPACRVPGVACALHLESASGGGLPGLCRTSAWIDPSVECEPATGGLFDHRRGYGSCPGSAVTGNESHVQKEGRPDVPDIPLIIGSIPCVG